MSASTSTSTIPVQTLAIVSPAAEPTSKLQTPTPKSSDELPGWQTAHGQDAVDVDQSTLESQISQTADQSNGINDGNDVHHSRATSGKRSRRWTLVERTCALTASLLGIILLAFSVIGYRYMKWTALKDFREDCRARMAFHEELSRECRGALVGSLRPPPFYSRDPKAYVYSDSSNGALVIWDGMPLVDSAWGLWDQMSLFRTPAQRDAFLCGLLMLIIYDFYIVPSDQPRSERTLAGRVMDIVSAYSVVPTEKKDVRGCEKEA